MGNKKDIYEEEEVSDEEAMSYAEEINVQFFSVSANLGEGIDETFQTLANNFFNREFMKKIDKVKEERVNSIILQRKNYGKSRGNKKCC